MDPSVVYVVSVVGPPAWRSPQPSLISNEVENIYDRNGAGRVMVGYLDIAREAEAVWLAENQRRGYDRNDRNDQSPLVKHWRPNSPPVSLKGDWRAFVAERRARLVTNGVVHIQAERLAYEAAVVEVQDLIPHKDGLCGGCGRPVEPPFDAVLGDGAIVHYGGAHGQQCWRDHQVKVRDRAVRALAELGIQRP